MARHKRYQLDMDGPEFEEAPKSRSQKKRDSHALKDIGAELAKLTPGQIKKLPLNEDLLEALKVMAKITDKEGRRRQGQYIGKLMRECDPAPILDALEKLKQGHNEDTALLHHAERLREALLTAPEAQVKEIISAWPEAQQELLKLVDRAKSELSPEVKRTLFKKLKSLLAQ